MQPALDKLMQRLNTHQKTVELDNSAILTGTPVATPSGDPVVNSAIMRLKEDLKPSKGQVANHLEKLTDKLNWILSVYLIERVALGLLLLMLLVFDRCANWGKAWFESKGSQKHHIGHEVTMLYFLLDNMIQSFSSFINTDSCGIIGRRICGLMRAFTEVSSTSDWQQPRGNAGQK